MNLVQKLPVGLSLACLMAMSSCSREDVQNPMPEVQKNKTEAEMRGIGSENLPYMPTVPITTAGVGKGTLAKDWQKDVIAGSADSQKFPIGTSRPTALWGLDGSKSFIPALPEIPEIPDSDEGSFLSVTVNTPLQSLGNGLKSVAKTTIKGMTPGHEYELTYYVACAVPEKAEDGSYTSYAEQATMHFRYNSPATSMYSGLKGVTNLANKQSQWIKNKIYFTAEDTEVDLLFSGTTKKAGQWSYVHLFVGKSALKRLF